MKKSMMILALAVIPLAGCETVVEQVEPLVDQQIEREERAAGIWETPDSYYWGSWEDCHE